MTFQILLFATLKDRVGQDAVKLEKNAPMKVADLLEDLYVAYPQLSPYKKSILVAVNKNFASPTQIVHPEDEIALFPPVSGG